MRLAFRDSSISRAVRLRPAALALTALVLWAGLSHAAERQFNGALVEIRSKDREALETLASGTEELRQAALEVSAHPRLLNRVHNLQRSSSNAFRDLVGGLPRDEQERVWELIRYPDLIASIVDGGRKREAELQSLAAPYPENVREIAVDLGRRQYSLLLRIYALHAQSERDFERELSARSRDHCMISRMIQEVGVLYGREVTAGQWLDDCLAAARWSRWCAAFRRGLLLSACIHGRSLSSRSVRLRCCCSCRCARLPIHPDTRRRIQAASAQPPRISGVNARPTRRCSSASRSPA